MSTIEDDLRGLLADRSARQQEPITAWQPPRRRWPALVAAATAAAVAASVVGVLVASRPHRASVVPVVPGPVSPVPLFLAGRLTTGEALPAARTFEPPARFAGGVLEMVFHQDATDDGGNPTGHESLELTRAGRTVQLAPTVTSFAVARDGSAVAWGSGDDKGGTVTWADATLGHRQSLPTSSEPYVGGLTTTTVLYNVGPGDGGQRVYAWEVGGVTRAVTTASTSVDGLSSDGAYAIVFGPVPTNDVCQRIVAIASGHESECVDYARGSAFAPRGDRWADVGSDVAGIAFTLQVRDAATGVVQGSSTLPPSRDPQQLRWLDDDRIALLYDDDHGVTVTVCTVGGPCTSTDLTALDPGFDQTPGQSVWMVE